MNVGDILRIPAEEAGDPVETTAGTDVLDIPFAEPGYDSLTLRAPAGRIQHEYEVTIADERFDQLDMRRTLPEAMGGPFPSGA